MAITREDIINEIKKVYDPEIPVNIWDLGLIYVSNDGRYLTTS